MNSLTSLVWWKAATVRALRTALVVSLPYVPASYIGAVPYLTIALVASLAIILSFVTSLAGLSETDSSPLQPWWYAVLSRVVKTTAQALVTGFGTAALLTDVPWDDVGQMALTAGFGSLLLALLSQLPEAEIPVAKTEAGPPVLVINTGSDPVSASLLETVSDPTAQP